MSMKIFGHHSHLNLDAFKEHVSNVMIIYGHHSHLNHTLSFYLYKCAQA